MKDTSIQYLQGLIKTQEACSKNEELKDMTVVYTHVEGYSKEKALYEIRVFMAMGKYIKDITIDVAFATEYQHNNKRLYYKAPDNLDPEELLVRKLSAALYNGKEDAVCYMKI